MRETQVQFFAPLLGISQPTVWNANFRGSNNLFWTPQAPEFTHAHRTYTYTHNLKIKINFKAKVDNVWGSTVEAIL